MSTVQNVNSSIQARSVAALGKSNSLNTEKSPAASKLDGDIVYLVRLKHDANMEVGSVIKEISTIQAPKSAKNGDVLVVIRSAEDFA